LDRTPARLGLPPAESGTVVLDPDGDSHGRVERTPPAGARGPTDPARVLRLDSIGKKIRMNSTAAKLQNGR
jgi:hypothetical protein